MGAETRLRHGRTRKKERKETERPLRTCGVEKNTQKVGVKRMDKKCERCFLGFGLGVRVVAVPDRRRDLRRRRGEGVRTKTKVQDKVTQTHDSLGGAFLFGAPTMVRSCAAGGGRVAAAFGPPGRHRRACERRHGRTRRRSEEGEG